MARQYSAAQRAQFAADRATKIAAAKDALRVGAERLSTSEGWRTALEQIAASPVGRFSPRRLSFRNQLLLMVQGAYGPVATFKSWIDAGRCVRKGEKSRAFILQPRPFKRERETAAGEVVQEGGMAFGTLAMFTLDQTDGEALPKLTGEIDPSQDLPATFERLSQLAESLPCVSRVSVREGNVETGPRGWFDRSDGSIVVIRQDNVPAMVKTLVHEVAHAILHGETGHHDRAQNEVEAESAAFVVCHTIGLDTSEYSFPYVTSWAGEGGPAKAIVAAGDAITRASGVILDALFPSDEGAADVAEAAE